MQAAVRHLLQPVSRASSTGVRQLRAAAAAHLSNSEAGCPQQTQLDARDYDLCEVGPQPWCMTSVGHGECFCNGIATAQIATQG